MNIFHLRKHGLDEKSYLEKYPGSQLMADECKKNISEGTKKGMRKEASWDKFMTHVRNRDYTGENNSFYGKHHSEETKRSISQNEERSRKISKKKSAWWADGRIGMNFEELYGKETAERVSRIKSEQTTGENNPAYGKVYEKTGRKVGRYRGILFRSLYEYSYYKHLETQDLFEEMEYEPFSIPFKLDGRKRTYTPDVLLTSEKKLIEIKSTYELGKATKLNEEKFKAAIKYCSENDLTFEVLTEKDFKIIPFRLAERDENVEWIKK